MPDDDTTDPIDEAARELVDAERHRQVVDERRRRHWLRLQLDEQGGSTDGPSG